MSHAWNIKGWTLVCGRYWVVTFGLLSDRITLRRINARVQFALHAHVHKCMSLWVALQCAM
jgi:hypothetical protein